MQICFMWRLYFPPRTLSPWEACFSVVSLPSLPFQPGFYYFLWGREHSESSYSLMWLRLWPRLPAIHAFSYPYITSFSLSLLLFLQSNLSSFLSCQTLDSKHTLGCDNNTAHHKALWSSFELLIGICFHWSPLNKCPRRSTVQLLTRSVCPTLKSPILKLFVSLAFHAHSSICFVWFQSFLPCWIKILWALL